MKNLQHFFFNFLSFFLINFPKNMKKASVQFPISLQTSYVSHVLNQMLMYQPSDYGV